MEFFSVQIHTLDLNAALATPLFNNPKIKSNGYLLSAAAAAALD